MSYRYRCRLYCTPSGPERENKKKKQQRLVAVKVDQIGDDGGV